MPSPTWCRVPARPSNSLRTLNRGHWICDSESVGPTKPDPAIVIVAIDEKSEDVLGRWPFPRTVFADTLDFLHDAKTRVVAFDINFPEPDENSALETLRHLKKTYQSRRKARQIRSSLPNWTDMELAADHDKILSDAIGRFGNAILGYFFLFNRMKPAARTRKSSAAS